MASPSRAYVVAPGEGPVWDMEPGRPTAFKLMSESTGGKIATFEETVPPGAGTPLHIHHTSDEIIYVASGEFDFRLGDDIERVASGAWVFIPLGSVHGWRNRGGEAGHLLNIFCPGAGAKAFEEMRLQGVPVPEVDAAKRDEIFRRHGYEFLTWDW
jgi:quercetin dioxygenase-like cupin family protein